MDVKFNLKLFVLVGVLAGFRDVCGMEDIENEDYDGFIVAGFEGNDENEEKKALTAAIDGNRVIKAVYQTEVGGIVDLINSNFQNKLSYILVCDGHKVEKVETKYLSNVLFKLGYNMPGKGEYTVYFIFNNGNVDSTASMFFMCNSLIRADFRYFNTKNVTNMISFFSGCTALTELNLNNFNTTKVKDMSYMFYNCTALTELNLNNFKTTSVTNMSNMFYKCSALTKLDLSSFDTKNVTNMSNMFRGCTALKELDLRNFYFSPVCKMNDIFQGCDFNNLCLPNLRRRCWCCCCRYVYLKGKVFGFLNQNNVEFVDGGQNDLIGS